LVENIRPDVIYSSCEFALLIFGGLENLGFEIEKTHPSAIARIENLRKNLKAICRDEEVYKNLTKFADGNTAIYNKVISVISQPTKKQKNYFTQQAQEIINKINDLLNRCSGGFVPDYATFNREMHLLFDFGYHHKIIYEVFKVGQVFFQDIKNFEDNNSQSNETTTRNFHKFKLFFGFIDQLPETAKNIFQEKLSLMK